MADGPRARPQNANDRDRRVLMAARALFASQGFERTSIADVAKAADVAVGTVYLRFATKSDLLAGVLKSVKDRFVEVMSAPDIHHRPWRERMRPLFEALLSEAALQPDLPALMSLTPHLPVQGGPDCIQAWIETFMTEGQAAGAFRTMPTATAAAIAFGMVEGAMQDMLRSRGSVSATAAVLADAAERWMIAD